MSQAIHNLPGGGRKHSPVYAAVQFGSKWGSWIGMAVGAALILAGGPASLGAAGSSIILNLVTSMAIGAVAGAVAGGTSLWAAATVGSFFPPIRRAMEPAPVIDHPRAAKTHLTDPVNEKALDDNKFSARAGKAPKRQVYQAKIETPAYQPKSPGMYWK